MVSPGTLSRRTQLESQQISALSINVNEAEVRPQHFLNPPLHFFLSSINTFPCIKTLT
jgi:hypothetical protein